MEYRTGFEKLFPMLSQEGVGIRTRIEEDLKHLCEMYTEFSFNEDQSVSVTGDDWQVTIRGDRDHSLKPTYEALLITYCPRELVSSGYFDSPEKALFNLSNKVKRAFETESKAKKAKGTTKEKRDAS